MCCDDYYHDNTVYYHDNTVGNLLQLLLLNSQDRPGIVL